MTDKDIEYRELCVGLRERFINRSDSDAKYCCDAADAIESLQARQHQSDLNYDALEKQNTALQAEVARLKAANEARAEYLHNKKTTAMDKYIDECEKQMAALRAENAELRNEIDTLRFYGNKAATALADEFLQKGGK